MTTTPGLFFNLFELFIKNNITYWAISSAFRNIIINASILYFMNIFHLAYSAGILTHDISIMVRRSSWLIEHWPEAISYLDQFAANSVEKFISKIVFTLLITLD